MIKKENGITLVSLIITIIMMVIIASTVGTVSLERFKINNFKKMANDIELLQDKVLNYYLKYGGLPILRDNTTNAAKIYPDENFTFTKNAGDNSTYYIIDLEALEGIALNYGSDGFKVARDTGVAKDDIYIINQRTHTIYYVKGMELDGVKYHYISSGGTLNDSIPPSKPQINVISGTKSGTDSVGNAIYSTQVEIEIIPGKDGWSAEINTIISITKDGTTIEPETLKEHNAYVIKENGEYKISATTKDNSENEQTAEVTILVEIPENIS